MRVLPAALRRDVRHGAFQNFQQSLLHALARNVARDGRVLVLAADFVNLVNVDNALLRALNVAVGRLQEFEDDVLNVLADVARFRERRRVNDGEGNHQHARERLRQKGLARAGGADEQYVRLLNLYVRSAACHLDALIVLVDGDGEALLGLLLADDVLVEERLDLGGFGEGRARGDGLGLLVVGDDLVADVNALVADVDGGPGDELLDFVLRLAAERAAQRVISSAYHSFRGLTFV